MAQAKGKAKKKPAKSAGPWKGVALYHLDESTVLGAKARAALSEAGIAVKTLHEDRLADAVGSIAHLPGFHTGKTPFTGDAPKGEFMLVCNMTPAELDNLLAVLKAADASIGPKAQITQKNKVWPIVKLINEVTTEHNALTNN